MSRWIKISFRYCLFISPNSPAKVYSSLHRTLLNGDLIFAYKGPAGANFYQIVIVQELNWSGKRLDTYEVGITTHGFSALLPHVPFSYLENEVLSDLIGYKVNKEIINVYQKILNEHKNV